VIGRDAETPYVAQVEESTMRATLCRRIASSSDCVPVTLTR
jgi:hypothetical protein